MRENSAIEHLAIGFFYRGHTLTLDGWLWKLPDIPSRLAALKEYNVSEQSTDPRRMTDDEAAEFAEQVFDLARKGDARLLGLLLEKNLTPNLRNHKGDTLLMLACYHGHLEAARVLLDYKADPEIRNDNGQSPIAGAAFKGDLEMVQLLVEHGAEVEGASADGRTALMMAAMFNRSEIVAFLVSKGANPHARDAKGVTALAAAQTMGASDTAEMLSKFGV